MSRTVSIEDGRAFAVEPGEVVLDAAARHGIELPHECRAGNRGTCRVKLVEGRTLAALLAERDAPGEDLSRFVAAFEQVCQAVGFAHSHGVVHRDGRIPGHGYGEVRRERRTGG